MLRLLLVMAVLLPFSFSKKKSVVQKKELPDIYTKSISEYIQAIYTKDKIYHDTLFSGKNSEFPEIKFPAEIAKTKILVLSQEEADKKMLYKKSMTYINLISWETNSNIKFLFVNFLVSDGYKPQHNCEVDYTFNAKEKVYKLEGLEFKYPYPGN